MRLGWLALLGVAGLLHAQNSDLALLAGISGPHGEVVQSPTSVISGSVGASGQINYAWQVVQRAVDLYVELPLVLTGENSGVVRPAMVSSTTGLDVFFTPGVRVKFSPQSRVSFYAAVGGGVASLGSSESVVEPGLVTEVNKRTASAALDFGGGIDFRLTRLLSLRVDGRDFVKGRDPSGASGRNRWMVLVGVAFHF